MWCTRVRCVHAYIVLSCVQADLPHIHLPAHVCIDARTHIQGARANNYDASVFVRSYTHGCAYACMCMRLGPC